MKRWKRGAAMLLCLCMMTSLLSGWARGKNSQITAYGVMKGNV